MSTTQPQTSTGPSPDVPQITLAAKGFYRTNDPYAVVQLFERRGYDHADAPRLGVMKLVKNDSHVTVTLSTGYIQASGNDALTTLAATAEVQR